MLGDSLKCKSQRLRQKYPAYVMGWPRLAAQLMLDVKTAHLDGILECNWGLPLLVEWIWPNDSELRKAD